MVKKIIILLFITAPLYGTDYYVKTGGNNSADGLSDANAWATIAKVNGSSFSAGDRIFFRRGDTFSDATLTPPSSGTAGSLITFGAYGTGADPIITCRGELPLWSSTGSWTQSGDSWYMSYGGNYRFRIWLNGIEARRAHYVGDLNAGFRYYYSRNSGDATPLYQLYIYSATNPATAFTSIEISGVRSSALYVNTKNYLLFQDLDFQGGGGGGYYTVNMTSSNNITFNGCSIGEDTGCYGLRASASSNVIVADCNINSGDTFEDYYQSETSEDGIAIFDGCNYWTIENNTFTNWGHTALAIINYGSGTTNYNIVRDNTFTAPDIDYGRAIQFAGHEGYTVGCKFYRNYIHDMPIGSMLGGPYVEFFNNIIYGIRGTPYEYYDTGQGLDIQELSDQGHTVHYMKIYNNTIVNCVGGGIKFIGWEMVNGISNIDLTNNLIYNCATESGYPVDFDNYEDISVINFKHNLVYTSGITAPIYYRGTAYRVYVFDMSEVDYDIFYNNLGDPPMLVSATDLHLQQASPAVFSGYAPTLSATDYDLVTWGTPPAIGAYEYASGTVEPSEETEGKFLKHNGKFLKYNGKFLIR